MKGGKRREKKREEKKEKKKRNTPLPHNYEIIYPNARNLGYHSERRKIIHD